MQDRDGRKYAKLSKIFPGDMVEVDTGFDCITPGIHKIEAINGRMALKCSHGLHFLDGQTGSDADSLIGIYAEWKGEKQRWVVVDNESAEKPGDPYDILGVFGSKQDAEDFVAVLAVIKPAKTARGGFGIDESRGTGD